MCRAVRLPSSLRLAPSPASGQPQPRPTLGAAGAPARGLWLWAPGDPAAELCRRPPGGPGGGAALGGGDPAGRRRSVSGSQWFSGSRCADWRGGLKSSIPANTSRSSRRHRRLSGRISNRARPGRQDATGVPGGEAQPAAEREPLLARVLLVSAPPGL